VQQPAHTFAPHFRRDRAPFGSGDELRERSGDLGLAAGHSCLLSFDADPTGAPLSLPGSVDIVPPSAPPVFPIRISWRAVWTYRSGNWPPLSPAKSPVSTNSCNWSNFACAS